MIPANGIVAMTPHRFLAPDLFLDLRWYFALTRWEREGSTLARMR
jgi:hypothetical protein